MTGHVSGLGAQVASAGAPWGSDTTGERFAGVANGFVAHMQQSLQAMAARAETVQRHADRLAAHARVFEQADQA
ncbi:hypothetical protein A5736_00040 [Mycobacterium sp. SP-6446]|nr:hypothetical protein A5736_00040 [Mycobacterium sp. SP-6446]